MTTTKTDHRSIVALKLPTRIQPLGPHWAHFDVAT